MLPIARYFKQQGHSDVDCVVRLRLQTRIEDSGSERQPMRARIAVLRQLAAFPAQNITLSNSERLQTHFPWSWDQYQYGLMAGC